jgi:hypothetical protein
MASNRFPEPILSERFPNGSDEIETTHTIEHVTPGSSVPGTGSQRFRSVVPGGVPSIRGNHRNTRFLGGVW